MPTLSTKIEEKNQIFTQSSRQSKKSLQFIRQFSVNTKNQKKKIHINEDYFLIKFKLYLFEKLDFSFLICFTNDH